MNTLYEKPQMKYVAMRNEEKVANTCWGYHGTGKNLYADIDGPGYCGFQIGGKSCTLSLVNVTYVKKVLNPETQKYDIITDAADADQIKELTAILVASGGESGNPYSGEGTVVKPEPDPKWS